MPQLSRRGHGEHGAAAVEFAIILPILVLLLFGIIQFAIAYNRTQGLHAAAREGARVGSLPQTTSSEIRDRVDDALSGVLPPGAATVTVSPATARPCNLRSGEKVQVAVSYEHTIDIPLWGTEPVTLGGKGEFRCE